MALWGGPAALFFPYFLITDTSVKRYNVSFTDLFIFYFWKWDATITEPWGQMVTDRGARRHVFRGPMVTNPESGTLKKNMVNVIKEDSITSYFISRKTRRHKNQCKWENRSAAITVMLKLSCVCVNFFFLKLVNSRLNLEPLIDEGEPLLEWIHWWLVIFLFSKWLPWFKHF